VIEASEKLVCIKIDTDKDSETAEKYQVEAIPTIYYLKPNGDIIKESEASDAEGFAKEMEEMVKSFKEEGEGGK